MKNKRFIVISCVDDDISFSGEQIFNVEIREFNNKSVMSCRLCKRHISEFVSLNLV